MDNNEGIVKVVAKEKNSNKKYTFVRCNLLQIK